MTTISADFRCTLKCAFNHHGFCCNGTCHKIDHIEQKLIDELIDHYNPNDPLYHTNKAKYLLNLLDNLEKKKEKI